MKIISRDKDFGVAKSVTIKSFLPQREIEICQRLRQVRLGAGLEQAEFASQIGMTRVRLASYEYAKAPVRFSVGISACVKFGINQRWLATGQSPQKPFFDLAIADSRTTLDDQLYSEVFDNVISSSIENQFAQLYSNFGKENVESGELHKAILRTEGHWHWSELPPAAAAFYIGKFIQDCLNSLPKELVHKLSSALLSAHSDFMQEHGREIRKWFENHVGGLKRANTKELEIDEVHESVNSGDVKAQWPLLKARLQKATEPVGLKSKLAKFLGVKLASVSQWLSDSDSQREPGAETTLRMLRWVELQERKS